MWNIATDPRECIGNNKVMTPSFDVKMPFTLASDNDQLEKDIIEFDQEKYDRVLNEFHKKVGLVFGGRAREMLAEKIVKIIDEGESESEVIYSVSL